MNTRTFDHHAGCRPSPLAPARDWPSALVLVLIGLSIWHAWVVTHVDAGLHVDEAQYWLWSKDLDWGYFSKPPMVAALIALSTDWLGDSPLGVRALAMLCYPLTAAVIFSWVRDVVADVAPGPQARPERAGQFAALVFIASPVAGLLGLVATTDAPLLLAWALASRALWQAWRDGRRRDHLWLGLWLGLGLLSKYTMAAFAASALGVLLLVPRRAPRALPVWQGLLWTALPALLCLLPNLWWNAAHGWPTLRHTAEITLGASATNPWRTEGEYLAGLLLLLGPIVAPWALAWRGARGKATLPLAPGATVARRDARRIAAWLMLPLVTLGALQSLHAKAQVNWTAPALIGGVLALALWVHAEQPKARLRGWYMALAAQVLLVGGITLSGDLAHALHKPLPRQLDVWARMRGWDEAFAQLRPQAEAWFRQQQAADPQAPRRVLGSDRAIIANGGYAWRTLQPQWLAWRDPGRPAADHFQLTAPLEPGDAPQALLIVSDGPPALSLRPFLAGEPRLLAVAEVEQTPGRLLRLELWAAEVAPRPRVEAKATRGAGPARRA
ncbi:MAG: ArnT family glycosyltransferase [Pseudomonadota bacterium]